MSPPFPKGGTGGFAVLALLAIIAVAPAAAQGFPARQVKFVVPTSAGGATDAFARALAQGLGEAWGQPALVENRPGANQIIGAD